MCINSKSPKGAKMVDKCKRRKKKDIFLNFYIIYFDVSPWPEKKNIIFDQLGRNYF